MTTNQQHRISIKTIKNKLVDNFILYGAIFATIVFLIPLIPFNFENLNFYNYIDLLTIISLYIIFYQRDKVSLSSKGSFILFAVYLFFIADFYQHGLYSTVKSIIIFIPFLGVLVYEVKWAVLIFIITMITYTLIAYGYLSGQLFPGSLDPTLNLPYKWIVNGILLSLVAIIVAMFMHNFNQSLLQIIEQQDKSYNVLEQQEQELKISVEEKNVLLQEIHHRVKNNLAVVSGLLDLQSNLAPDTFTRSALKLSTNRIISISKVHELLYQSEDVSRIDLNKYIRELTDIIIGSFNKNNFHIDLKLDINVPYLNINHGVPVGIILNELVTNSLKHGFNRPQDRYEIEISAHEEDGHYHIGYHDNGSGIIETVSEKKSGLGTTLIESLLKQIDAEFWLKTDGYYQITFRFPNDPAFER
ncbi:MAG TPA: hypothetical protein DF712_14740 [Balneola sp.]|nr:hypothetical protein [Bacteroidota bacterium]HCT53708.1 hypothetical protein [Balneola sp.]|tara:strand:- start:446 stop:1690 length:1245 start_codon:yes stop_codon:yes gene_type:complete